MYTSSFLAGRGAFCAWSVVVRLLCYARGHFPGMSHDMVSFLRISVRVTRGATMPEPTVLRNDPRPLYFFLHCIPSSEQRRK